MTEEEGTITEEMMRRGFKAAQSHMMALSAAIAEACPEAPPEVMIISLLAFYLGRALTDSDGYAEIINGALDNTGARYRLQRRGH